MPHTKSNIVYVIVGANKGIGLGLAKALVAQPRTTVIATVRNNDREKELSELSSQMEKGQDSSLYIFQVDLSHAPDVTELRKRIKDKISPIAEHIDVFILSAGFTTKLTSALETSPEALRQHFEINTIGPLATFQAFWPLIKRSDASQPSPKAIFLSSSVGSIGQMEPVTGGAYGPSKAALNWITRKIHFELEQDALICAAVHPGWVQTEMGQTAAKSWSYPGSPPLTVDDSVRDLVKLIEGATRENTSGKFLSYDGTEIPW